MNKLNVYETPEISLILIEGCDIITASDGNGDFDPGHNDSELDW